MIPRLNIFNLLNSDKKFLFSKFNFKGIDRKSQFVNSKKERLSNKSSLSMMKIQFELIKSFDKL